MTTAGTINSVRYLVQNNLRSEQDLQRNYFREVAAHWGINATYFRQGETYNSLLSTIYGEAPNMEYTLSAPIVIYMDMNQDVILLNKFGLQTDTDSIVYILKEDFIEQFRDTIGSLTSAIISSTTSAIVSAGISQLSYEFYNLDVSAMISASLSGLNTISSGTVDYNLLRIPKLYHSQVYKSKAYTTRYLDGIVSGNYSATVDLSGNGTVNSTLNGTILYFKDSDINSGPNWSIAPKVDDFFRLEFDNQIGNSEEYIITKVYDKDLSNTGINPLLARYLFKLNVARRDPTYENVSGATYKEEQFTEQTKSEESSAYQSKSESIFNYKTTSETDLLCASNVYGNY